MMVIFRFVYSKFSRFPLSGMCAADIFMSSPFALAHNAKLHAAWPISHKCKASFKYLFVTFWCIDDIRLPIAPLATRTTGDCSNSVAKVAALNMMLMQIDGEHINYLMLKITIKVDLITHPSSVFYGGVPLVSVHIFISIYSLLITEDFCQ